MDPDREALKDAIKEENDFWAQEGPHWKPRWKLIIEAASRDLARLEGEGPKKATLEEIAQSVLYIKETGRCNCGKPTEDCNLIQAAAVLRAVGDLQNAKIGFEEFMRSLP